MPLPTDAELAAARAVAVDANLLARDAESKARKLRRTADAAQRHYDDLLKERNFMTIDDYYQEA